MLLLQWQDIHISDWILGRRLFYSCSMKTPDDYFKMKVLPEQLKQA